MHKMHFLLLFIYVSVMRLMLFSELHFLNHRPLVIPSPRLAGRHCRIY